MITIIIIIIIIIMLILIYKEILEKNLKQLEFSWVEEIYYIAKDIVVLSTQDFTRIFLRELGLLPLV